MAAPAINLAGRVPVFKKAFSNRILWLGAGLVVLFVAAVIFGFRYRFQRQAAQKESQQAQTTASDAATSNRSQLEGGQLPPSTLSGLPVATSPSAATAPVPTGGQGTHPAVQAPAYQFYAYPTQTVAAQTSPVETAVQRAAQRREQAIEAPTGGTEPRANVTSPAATNPAANDLAQLSALMQPAASGGSTMAPVSGVQPGFAGPQQPGALVQDPNDQTGKRQFAAESGERASDDYLKTTRTPPLSPWVVQRGEVIPAVLPNKVVSDLPGDLIAEVARDVYDSPTHRFVEIPAGSRLVGEFNSNISYGQSRVQIVWTAVYFPDGSYIDLDRMPSHSADGATGLTDQTDNHLKRLIGGVTLSSLLAAGLQISQNRTTGSVLQYPSTTQEIGSAVGSQASELGQQITQRNLNVQPTLKIRPGELFAVSVKKDIVFDGPYQALEERK